MKTQVASASLLMPTRLPFELLIVKLDGPTLVGQAGEILRVFLGGQAREPEVGGACAAASHLTINQSSRARSQSRITGWAATTRGKVQRPHSTDRSGWSGGVRESGCLRRGMSKTIRRLDGLSEYEETARPVAGRGASKKLICFDLEPMNWCLHHGVESGRCGLRPARLYVALYNTWKQY